MREDAIRLYGFLTRRLSATGSACSRSVQGVGAKVALGILGALTADAPQPAIARQDKAMMARAPGVGPKLAARLVLELKDKAPAFGVVGFRRRRLAAECASKLPKAAEDAILALVGLGYARPQAAAAIARMLGRARRRRADGGADPGGAEGTGAVSAADRPRRLVLPLVGLVLLFAVLGPAIGGALFVPLAVVLKPPDRRGHTRALGLIAACSGHTVGLIAAYVVGDRAGRGDRLRLRACGTPRRPSERRARSPPRSSAARSTYGVALRLASLGAPFELTIDADVGASSRRLDRCDVLERRSTPRSRTHSSSAAAVAGLVCAMRREPHRPDDAAGLRPPASAIPPRGGA